MFLLRISICREFAILHLFLASGARASCGEYNSGVQGSAKNPLFFQSGSGWTAVPVMRHLSQLTVLGGLGGVLHIQYVSPLILRTTYKYVDALFVGFCLNLCIACGAAQCGVHMCLFVE